MHGTQNVKDDCTILMGTSLFNAGTHLEWKLKLFYTMHVNILRNERKKNGHGMKCIISKFA